MKRALHVPKDNPIMVNIYSCKTIRLLKRGNNYLGIETERLDHTWSAENKIDIRLLNNNILWWKQWNNIFKDIPRKKT